jgi:hypothetical protein
MSANDDPDDLQVRAARVRERASALDAELPMDDALRALVIAAYDQAEAMEHRAAELRSQRADASSAVDVRERDAAPH